MQIFRDGRRTRYEKRIQLPAGVEGNYQTLRIMARIVREDALYPDLGNYVRRHILGSGSVEDQITSAYEYCRDRIKYLPEQAGYETVADLWSCEYGMSNEGPVGDCAVKSVALATALSYLKNEVTPFFIALRQVPGANYFNHVLVGIRRPDGTDEALDPTPPEARRGDPMQAALTVVRYHIWKP